jgi:F0F1-type ATP synthase membrane subunit b/b'
MFRKHDVSGVPASNRKEYHDRSVERYKIILAVIFALGAGYCLGIFTGHLPQGEPRLLASSLFGGALAFLLSYGVIGKTIFDNLQKVAESRGSQIEELSGQIQRMEASHAEQISAALKEQSDDFNKTIAALNDRIAQIEEDRDGVTKERDGHKKVVDALQQALVKAQQQAQEAEATSTNWRLEIEHLHEKLKTEQKEKKMLSDILSQLRSEPTSGVRATDQIKAIESPDGI